MHPVIMMIVFLVHGHAIGAQLVGSAETVQACQIGAAEIVARDEGQEPKDAAGNTATAFPVCIDTRPMAGHQPSTQL